MKLYTIHILYMVASVLFMFGLKRLSSVKTARKANMLSAAAMAVAILATILDLYWFETTSFDLYFILIGSVIGGGIGAYFAYTVEMTAMPQMVAIFNGMGGLASLLVALSYFWEHAVTNPATTTLAGLLSGQGAVSIVLSILIGAVTFTGSLVAFGKLQGIKWVPDQPVLLPGRHFINLGLIVASLVLGYIFTFVTSSPGLMVFLVILITLATLALGVLLVIPIGGADMPVVISLLNSYSGLAAAMTGFVINNSLLIISGSLVGASGLILTKIMCDAMNRSLANVLFGGFGAEASSGGGRDGYKNVKSTDAEGVAMLLDAARLVIFVPGYGMAVAQAQHAVRELADLLKERGCQVKYAIHPVAGRMPGHMNVLLAEANVPYDELYEMDEINNDFKNADVAIVLGANDVVNPKALDDPDSPIYGMPILHVHEAKSVVIIKRSLSPGFAGIPNPLFERDNAMMFFSDGRKAIEEIIKALKEMD